MGRKRSLLILTTTTAPYRVELFNELGKEFDLTVCFEQASENTRHNDWFLNNFKNFEGVFLKNSNKGLGRIKFDFGKYLRKKEYDAIIFYEYSTITSIFYIFLLSLLRVPYLLNCDGGFPEQTSWYKKIFKSFLIKNAVGYFAGGYYAKKYLKYYGANEKNIAIHNFTSIFRADISDRPLKTNEKIQLRKKLNIRGDKVAISVGRFIELKNFDVLIRAWADINSEYELLIIGGGDKKQEYVDLIEELGIKNIQIIDFMKKEQLFNYYLASDLFILPTSSDVWGLVINEAMACGLPIITTDKCIAGMELIENDRNGFIFPVGDIKGLTEKVEIILSNYSLQNQMSSNNLLKIRDYTYEHAAKVHINLLNSVLRK